MPPPPRFSRRALISALATCAVAALLQLLPACASASSLYTDASGQRSGKLIFERRCGVCHALPIPTSRTSAEWRQIMERMAVEAKLDGADKKRVTDWLVGSKGESGLHRQ